MSAALGAGCSIIVKAPEETPASPAQLIRAFADAGVLDGVSSTWSTAYRRKSPNTSIPHPVIREISFTGSTNVGKRLESTLAGLHPKRATISWSSAATRPRSVFKDADAISACARYSRRRSGRNAG